MTTAVLPGRRFTHDTIWNFTALGATAAVGGALVLLIAARMGPAALGVFAQLYAVHIIGAQAAVFGVHDSAQKHVAEFSGLRGRDDAIVVGALAVAVGAATVLAVLLVLTARWLASVTSSSDVGLGLLLTAPGIICFAINKVLFGAINGRGALRTYAIMQLLRALFVLAAAVAIVLPGPPAYAVGGIFAAAELVLLPCLLLAARPSFRRAGNEWGRWIARHLHFGGRGLVNSILLEAHLRVDVIMLAYFMHDRAIGIYSFAMLFAEAIYQVPVVVRTVAYPTLVQLASQGDRAGLARVIRRLSLRAGAAAIAAAAGVLIGYPLVAAWFAPAFLGEGGRVLQLLLAGMVVYAFFAPFDQLLLQSGQPGRQSVLMALYVGINVALNLLLIPRFGLAGAAAATAIALTAAGGMLVAASWIWLGLRGGVFLYKAPAA